MDDDIKRQVSVDIGRRNLLKLTGFNAAAAGVLSLSNRISFAQGTLAWDKTFPQSDRVDQAKVRFYNRLGINLVADMYVPRNLDRSRQSPAIIVGHPFGGVKEQTSGLYAQHMAERGFITVAFDASYNGESGGQPRSIASPEAFVEDFSAAVDFLGVHPAVDRNRIGVIGICGSGGFGLSAAQIDPRIKAVVTISMYDMGRDRRQGLGDTMSEADRRKAIETIALQRWIEAEKGEKIFVIGTPEVISTDSPAVAREFYDYYRTPRGFHPRSTTAMSLTSDGALMQFYPFQNLSWISPRPILLIAGEIANSRYFSEDAFKEAKEPKELYIVPGAGHVDLYDRLNFIPFDKIQSFFTKHLV
ncbi:alpha/beta hydrolase [Paraburkholderia youngii]|uniref:alpha/beta hydrolase n=1 Tax=Paraburkholderia youngii TaxID=2782701 RepID=UPI003D2481DF